MSQTPRYVLEQIQEVKDKQLKRLDLDHGNLTQIPEEIFDLTHLEELILYRNEIKTVPAEIHRLKNLKLLDLRKNPVEEITDVKGLVLDFVCYQQHKHQISSENISGLKINLENKAELPEEIFEFPNLNLLDLSENELTQIPESITKLQNLTTLNLVGNKFTKIPDAIYHLKSLEILDINNFLVLISKNKNRINEIKNGNQIKEISPKILQLENLKVLDLSGNPLENPPIEVVQKGVEAIKDYFRQLQEVGEDYLYEAKLLIVGEGGAGKTTLANKIKDENYRLKDEETTRGIDVIEWRFSMENGHQFRVNIWDFGGQEIYKDTHQFFLTKRSLYALVADMRKEDTDFFYWLNVVELLSDNSPLLIVKNEKQNRQREINENQLRERFLNLKETLATNLATNQGLPSVVDEIKHYITKLPHIGTKLPKTWTKVRETLEKDTRNYISLDEYLRICEDNGFQQLEYKLQLSGYLHDLGVCLHFQEDLLLKNTVILKPKWGTDAVYKVLDNDLVIKNEGQFNRRDLSRIWNEPNYAGKQEELLRLMLNFKLCYEIESSGNFIAPQLLKINKPRYEWDETHNLIFRYTYVFMPKGIITRFIVKMNHLIPDQELVWKEGVVLERDETRAEIIEDYDKRELKIRIAGRYKKDLLTIITYELDKIHESFHRLAVKKLIPCNCSACKGTQGPHFFEFDILRRFLVDRKPIQCLISYQMVDAAELIDDVMDQRDLFREPEDLPEKGKVVIEGSEKFVRGVMVNSESRREVASMVVKEENNLLLGVLSFGLLVFLVFTALVGVGYFITTKKLPFNDTFLLFSGVGIAFVVAIMASILVYDGRIKEETWLKVVLSDLMNFPIRVLEIFKKGKMQK
jgi:internalin A